jgi:MFS transporter, DHA3 family, macrolide efflux protein
MDLSAQQKIRTFYTILITQTLSLIGSRISALALGFWIFAETGEATPLTLVAFFTTVPMVLASGLSGVLADRWDRRHVMLIADFGQAAGTVLLLISFNSGSFELWHLYLIAALQSVFGVFQGPAFQASVTTLIPDDQRDRANLIQQLTGPMSGIIAPAIAGLIYAVVGVTGSILIDLATFAIAAVVIFLVRIPHPEETAEGRAMRGTLLSEMFGGLRYIWQRKPILALVAQFSLVNFLISGALALSTPYILSRTGSEAQLGLLLSVMNTGALVGGVLFSIWGGTRPRIHTILPGIVFSGFFLVLYGLSQEAIPMGIAMFTMMMPIPMVNALIMSVMQAKVAPDIQGRVFATIGQISIMLMPLSYLIAGPLADRVFEPAVLTEGWAAFAPLFGSTAGSGIGLLFAVAGTLISLSTLAVYALPLVRHMERSLPDYVSEPVTETPVGAEVMAADPAPSL